MLEDGSKCLIIERKKVDDITKAGNLFFGNTVGTIEFSPSDFLLSAYENIGSDRKLYIADLAIREDVRRMGFATILLNEIESYCRRHQYDQLYLHVEVENYNARKLYCKLGYTELSQNDYVISFTESRLQKASNQFVMLRKDIRMDQLPLDSKIFQETSNISALTTQTTQETLNNLNSLTTSTPPSSEHVMTRNTEYSNASNEPSNVITTLNTTLDN